MRRTTRLGLAHLAYPNPETAFASTSTTMVGPRPSLKITTRRRCGSGPGLRSPRRCSSLCKLTQAAPGAERKTGAEEQLSDHTRPHQLKLVLTSKFSRGEYECPTEPTICIRPFPAFPPNVGLRATTLVSLARVFSEITCFGKMNTFCQTRLNDNALACRLCRRPTLKRLTLRILLKAASKGESEGYS